MYNTLTFLVGLELFQSYFLGHIIQFISNHCLISEKRYENNNSEIYQLEEELKELNKPSTFTEYVKKKRQLNALKKTLNNGATQSAQQSSNIYIRQAKQILRGIYLMLKILNFLPPKLRQLLVFYLVKTYVNKSNIIIPFNQKLYIPFFQSKEKTESINSIMTYGVICTITDLIKLIIKFWLPYSTC